MQCGSRPFLFYCNSFQLPKTKKYFLKKNTVYDAVSLKIDSFQSHATHASMQICTFEQNQPIRACVLLKKNLQQFVTTNLLIFYDM